MRFRKKRPALMDYEYHTITPTPLIIKELGVLRDLNRGLAEDKARLMAHAAFGLMNSTPYSATPAGGRPSAAESRAVLRAMTVAALHANTRA